MHPKRYEKPVDKDFAGIIPDKDNDLEYSRDIRVKKTDNKLMKISETHPAADALGYALYFVKGTLGWSPHRQFYSGQSKKKAKESEQKIDQVNPVIKSKQKAKKIEQKGDQVNPEMQSKGKAKKSNQSNMTNLTLLMFMQFFLRVRKDSFNLLFKGRRLFHQFLVNKWADIETINLSFLKTNQNVLRVDLYSKLMSAHEKAAKSSNVGKPIVLPATFKGSPREMYELYQDAMAMVGKYGKPDLFITFTCNPNWREIREELLPGQSPDDRPDLICDVFKLKLDALLEEVIKKSCFGKVKGYVWVVEFQKRGLPHCHMLLILEDGYKIDSPEIVDKYISAQIPDIDWDKDLHEKVLRHMIHLPCSSSFRKCKKGKNRKCNKRFPKDFQNKTLLGDSYPLYRRRNTGTYDYLYNRVLHKISNQYVVPYSPYLLRRFNCHINVEVCSTIDAVKYLYKYVYKGFDKALVKMKDFDEISQYINSRYVSSVESTWRLRGYRLHGRYPAVYRLPVHLENDQNVIFKATDDLGKCLDQHVRTQLTEWFRMNDKYPKLRKYTYFEYPKYCTWNQNGKKKWALRERDLNSRSKPKKKSKKKDELKTSEDIVVRVYDVPPKDTERFYLKQLLRHAKGATSFDELKKHNGVQYSSFREVVLHKGLLDDDSIWVATLDEAVRTNCSGRNLRKLFVQLLVFADVSSPRGLWNRFGLKLGDDLKRNKKGEPIKLSDQRLEQKILKEIEKQLIELDKKLDDFKDLPKILSPVEINYGSVLEINSEEINTCKSNLEVLTKEQQAIYDFVENSLHRRNETSEEVQNIFIDGPGGSGKTVLLNTIIVGMLKVGFKVLAVSHSGLAATLLKNGRTACSMFKIPLNIQEGTYPPCNFSKNSQLAEFLKTIDCIVWDEAPVSPRFQIECVDRSLKDICDSDRLFGNKLVIFAGDFRQTLPVVPHGSRGDILKQTIKYSYIWEKVQTFKLTENLRLKERNLEFANYLLDIGEDRIEKVVDDEIQIREDLLFDPKPTGKCSRFQLFINYFFDSKEFKEGNLSYYQDTSILCSTNDDVIRLNDYVLDHFDSNSEEKTYFSLDTICPECENMNVETNVLNKINQSGLPLHELRLKTGAMIILIRNLDPNEGMCNGTRLVVLEMKAHLIIASITSGKFKGKVVQIPRIKLFSDDQKLPKFSRRQFPVKLAFVLSINKSQGQTLKAVALFLGNPIFAHGQLYVTVTRGEDPEKIKIFYENNIDENGNQIKTISNVVYPEILS